MSAKFFRYNRWLSAALMAVTAARHLVLAFGNDGSSTRHGVFVAINLALAALLVGRPGRPNHAFYPTLVLGTQQLWSHGGDLSRSFVGTAPLDWTSLAVCLFFTNLATLLYIERREERELAASGGP